MTHDEEIVLRKRIVEEALSWIGTDYHDHVGLKGVGVDCAYLPLRVYQEVGIIPREYEPPMYYSQQWLKKEPDPTYWHELQPYFREITEEQVQPGDFILFKICNSWTHGGIIISWPLYILHPLAGRGVVGSAAHEGFFLKRERRFFTAVK